MDDFERKNLKQILKLLEEGKDNVASYLDKIITCVASVFSFKQAQDDYENQRIDRHYELILGETQPNNKSTGNTAGFRLVYDKNSPELSLDRGGDAASQTMSRAQNRKKEDENLKYLTKRKDGRWQASKVINGKRCFVYGQTQAEAREKLKKLGNRKQHIKQYGFFDFSMYWLETYKKGQISDGTYKDYLCIIKRHLNIKTPLNKVTLLQLQELLNSFGTTRIREAVCQVMKAVLRKAYELDLIKKDIGAFLVKGKIKKSSREALNLIEQEKLINALGDDTFSRRVLLYLCTGARPSEIATIRKSELRPGWVKINGTKTKNAVRWVKVSKRISDILAGESSDFFKFDNKRFREHLQRFCKENGICDDIDVYTLRHTFATNLYILRVPEKDRQTYMGHVPGSAMTNGVYTTFSPDVTALDIYNIYGDLYPEF